MPAFPGHQPSGLYCRNGCLHETSHHHCPKRCCSVYCINSMCSTACWIFKTINPMRMFAMLQCYMPKCCNTRAMPPVATILSVHAGRMLRLPCSTAATVAGQRLHGRGTATAPAAVRRGRLSCCSACHPTTAGQLRITLTLRARSKHQQASSCTLLLHPSCALTIRPCVLACMRAVALSAGITSPPSLL